MALRVPYFRLPVGSLTFIAVILSALSMSVLPTFSIDDVFHYFEAEERPTFQLSDAKEVGIIPFVNLTGDGDIDWVGDAMTSFLVEEIGRGGEVVRVMDANVIEKEPKMRRGKIDLGELEQRMMKNLDMKTILRCEYRRSTRGIVRFSCYFVDPGTLKEDLAISECGTLDEIFEVQNRLSKEVRSVLDLTVADDKEKPRKVDVKSYEYFQKALSSPAGSYRRLHYCFKALEEDSDYNEARFCLAEAYYLIAISYGNQECLDRALKEYNKIIAVDPDHSKAHYRIGMVSFLKGNYDGSRNAFVRALEISPGMAEAKVGLRRLADHLER